MQIEYNKAKIETALLQFTKATGINAVFLKSDFSSFAIGQGNRKAVPNNYCESIQASENGKCRCRGSDRALLSKCAKTRIPEIHICHAGLVDVAVPIVYDEEIIGYILLGQMKEDKPFSDIKPYLKDLPLSLKTMEKQYEELSLFDPERISSIVSIAEMLAKFLLLENLLKPRFDFGIHTAVEYINDNLKSCLHLSEITHRCGLSKNTLYRGFLKEFGMTVGEYITKKRIEKAEKLLSETRLSIEEISVESGFSSAAYFAAIFKKHRGLSPLKFRKTRLNDEIQ